LHDFFKPILQDMATLRGMKRTRAGRRAKQLERLEQKQKEERQRRNREKQKDFCREVELHKYVLVVIDEVICYASVLYFVSFFRRKQNSMPLRDDYMQDVPKNFSCVLEPK
jgi:hypothetical protein